MAIPARPRVLRPETTVARTLLLGWVLAQVDGAAVTTDTYNLTWKSTNFKTILEWEPKPISHVYTVQISTKSGDWKGKCFHTTNTECDLTEEIVKDVKQTYLARVLTYPVRNLNTTGYAGEPPFEDAPEFTPYLETKLGQPVIQSFEQVGTKLNVTVQDARTLVRKNGTFLSLRDVFGKDLNYILYYWKDSSTGKKTAKTNTNEFLIDVDEGNNYCFKVQAVIPSRKTNQKSSESLFACTSQEKGVFKEMFFIVGAVVFVVIIFIIILSVSLYKCRKARARASGKESSPLNIS